MPARLLPMLAIVGCFYGRSPEAARRADTNNLVVAALGIVVGTLGAVASARACGGDDEEPLVCAGFAAIAGGTMLALGVGGVIVNTAVGGAAR